MTTPESPLRVAVQSEFDGVAITIGMRYGPTETRVVRIEEHGHMNMEDVGLETVFDPTMRLPDEFARALLDALLRHYQGASDLHQLRQDYLHERGRVDSMLATLSVIATAGKFQAVE